MAMFEPKKENRFVVVEEELVKNMGVVRMFVDTMTGMQYMYVLSSGSAGGLTVILDEDGKPFINTAYKRD